MYKVPDENISTFHYPLYPVRDNETTKLAYYSENKINEFFKNNTNWKDEIFTKIIDSNFLTGDENNMLLSYHSVDHELYHKIDYGSLFFNNAFYLALQLQKKSEKSADTGKNPFDDILFYLDKASKHGFLGKEKIERLQNELIEGGVFFHKEIIEDIEVIIDENKEFFFFFSKKFHFMRDYALNHR